MAYVQNFEMFQGTDKSIVVSAKDNDDVAVDVSGATAAQYEISKAVSSDSADVTKTLGAGIAIVTSTITITLDDTDTEDLEGQYYHELELTDVSGNIHTVFAGGITIKPTRITQ